MLLRLVLAGLAGAAVVFLTVPSTAEPLRFERECSGTADAACYHDFCGIVDCVRRDCVVYSDALGGGNAGICVGKARPRDPDS